MRTHRKSFLYLCLALVIILSTTFPTFADSTVEGASQTTENTVENASQSPDDLEEEASQAKGDFVEEGQEAIQDEKASDLQEASEDQSSKALEQDDPDEGALEKEKVISRGFNEIDNQKNPPLRAPSEEREEIHIQTKEELIALLNRKFRLSTFTTGDEYRYGVQNADIYLEGDFTISSDDVNANIPENTLYSYYKNSFEMNNCNFYGQGHSITITQGGSGRPIYSLFGVVSAKDNFVSTIKDLNLIYQGDVIGSGFAQHIYGDDNIDQFDISGINVTVNGDILPLLTEGWQTTDNSDTNAFAAGFALFMNSAKVDDVNVHVTGNIGTENPGKFEKATMDLIYGRSAGFYIQYRHRWPNNANPHDITNIKIQVDGSILAHSKHFMSEATGLGYNLQNNKFNNIDLHVKGDIKATTEGDYILDVDHGYPHDPVIATAGGQDLHHLENANLKVDGSILAIHDGNITCNVVAVGIGEWDHVNDFSDAQLQANPLTIKNVNLVVGGDIKAEAKDVNYGTGNDTASFKNRYLFACAGFANTMDQGVDNYDVCINNNVTVAGDVVAEGKAGFTNACLWGNFIGDDNTVSANSLKSFSEKRSANAFPFYRFVQGQRNTVSLTDGIYTKGNGGNVAGFADYVTNVDNAVDQNKMEVKKIEAEGVNNFGGFAVYNEKHKNQPTIDVDLKNIEPNIDDISIKSPKSGAVIGGFIAWNKGPIESCTMSCKNFTVSGSEGAFIGGFAAYNTTGQIKKSTLNLTNFNITDSKNNGGDLGGFVGLNKQPIEDCTVNCNSFTVDGPTACKLGGFMGRNSVAVKSKKNTANLTSLTLEGAGHVGGFIGYNLNGEIDESIANVKNIKVSGDVAQQASNHQNVGGFEGYGYGGNNQQLCRFC